MKLYAIEHEDGGRWWDVIELVWADELHPLSLFIDEGFARRIAKDHGTVVTFHLTREPELRVGASVVYKADVMKVSGLKTDGHVKIGLFGMPHADDLIVLPEEDV